MNPKTEKKYGELLEEVRSEMEEVRNKTNKDMIDSFINYHHDSEDVIIQKLKIIQKYYKGVYDLFHQLNSENKKLWKQG